MMKSRTTTARGFRFAEFPTHEEDCPILVEGPDDSEDGGDDRVCVYTRDNSGQWYRTYVERAGFDKPFVFTEKVAGRPDSYDEW
jgi:hypothetical protein